MTASRTGTLLKKQQSQPRVSKRSRSMRGVEEAACTVQTASHTGTVNGTAALGIDIEMVPGTEDGTPVADPALRLGYVNQEKALSGFVAAVSRLEQRGSSRANDVAERQ